LIDPNFIFLSKVPVIAVFTKFDNIINDTLQELEMQEGKSLEEAANEAPKRAKETFKALLRTREIYSHQYPPKCHVFLHGEFLFAREEQVTCHVMRLFVA
jgi:hypothetical protein